MSKFTGGKWEVDVIYGDRYVVYAETQDDAQAVADCYDNEDSEANARLIAAAPEMYRLLDDAAGMLIHLNHGDPLAHTINELLDEIDGKEDTEDEQ